MSLPTTLQIIADQKHYVISPAALLDHLNLNMQDSSLCMTWFTLYKESYWTDGILDRSYQYLATKLGVCRQTVIRRMAKLVKMGFLQKSHNFDDEGYQTNNTFTVQLPEYILSDLRQEPDRERKPLDFTPDYSVHDMYADIDEYGDDIDTDNTLDSHSDELLSMDSATLEVELKRELKEMGQEVEFEDSDLKEHLDKTPTPFDGFKADPRDFLYHATGKLSSFIHRGSRSVTPICNTRLNIYNTSPKKTIIHENWRSDAQISCYNPWVQPEKTVNKTQDHYEYNEPRTLPASLVQKIEDFVSSQNLCTSRKQLKHEAMFAISRVFTKTNIFHAFNTFKLLVRGNRWTTPFSMRKKTRAQ